MRPKWDIALTVTLVACALIREAPLPRIEAGQQLAKKLGIGGTPTLIVNGWRLASPPSSQELEKMIAEILAGRSPVSEKR